MLCYRLYKLTLRLNYRRIFILLNFRFLLLSRKTLCLKIIFLIKLDMNKKKIQIKVTCILHTACTKVPFQLRISDLLRRCIEHTLRRKKIVLNEKCTVFISTCQAHSTTIVNNIRLKIRKYRIEFYNGQSECYIGFLKLSIVYERL